MNGLRPPEILEALQAAEEAAERGGAPILATFVSLNGSVYSRAGAMAVFAPGDSSEAVIGIAETAGALRDALEDAAEQGRARLCSLSLAEDDPLLGFGLGAPGQVEVFLEPLTEDLRAHLRQVRAAVLEGRGVVCSLRVEGPRAGERRLLGLEDAQARECWEQGGPELLEESSRGKAQRTFIFPIRPLGRVLIFGSGPVAQALSVHAESLGFPVAVADPRPGRLRRGFARGRFQLIEGGWEQARAAVPIDAETSIVIATRSYALDLETLQGALKSPAGYVAVLGLPPRAQRMLRELEALEAVPRPGVLHAPAGLDIGAETPREAAVAVIAEILAARSGRRGGRPKTLIKNAGAAPASPKVPGLILAAGRGRRFASGHKLSARVDGKPVLRHVVENALASRLDPVVVVLGCEAEAALRSLNGLSDPRLRVVFNPRWEGGKGSSIECGLREIPAGAPGVVSLMGDMPRVPAWLIDRVISEFELAQKLVFPVYPGPQGPTKGCPTAFPRSLFGAIKALTGDDTAMAAVREHWGEAVKIPLEDAATQADVDTAEDLQLLLEGPAERA